MQLATAKLLWSNFHPRRLAGFSQLYMQSVEVGAKTIPKIVYCGARAIPQTALLCTTVDSSAEQEKHGVSLRSQHAQAR